MQIPMPITADEHDLVVLTKDSHKEIFRLNMNYLNDIQEVQLEAFSILHSC